MKIAFTAPMKPLDDPVPSGDRTMGRLIVKALEAGGHEVDVASRFRSWTKIGGAGVQQAIREEALREADRISAEWTKAGYRPDLFLTYHLYHKAPDWIGPALADAFDLPYVIVEASRAPKRQTGEWSFGFKEADKALQRADAVAALHHADAECLSAVVNPQKLDVLLPFLDTDAFETAALAAKKKAAPPLNLLAVGMMRDGDKTRSYEVLAEALGLLKDKPWQLTLIGDGPAREKILPLFPQERVTWLGALAPEELPAHYAVHDLVVWPAIREAFGFVFLEAQAAGTGVIAGGTFGVPDIVKDGDTGLLSPEGDAEAFAANLNKVLENPSLADDMGRAALRYIAETHSLASGTCRLTALLNRAKTNHSTAKVHPS